MYYFFRTEEVFCSTKLILTYFFVFIRFGAGTFAAARAAASAYKQQEETRTLEKTNEILDDVQVTKPRAIYVPTFYKGEPSPYLVMFREPLFRQ